MNSLYALIAHSINKALIIADSTVFYIKISAMFSSNKISHDLNSHIPYWSSTAHALHSSWIQTRQTISAMLSIATMYIAATHNITHSPCTSTCTSTCTTHSALPTPLPFTTLLCTQLTKHKAYFCKWQQNGVTRNLIAQKYHHGIHIS